MEHAGACGRYRGFFVWALSVSLRDPPLPGGEDFVPGQRDFARENPFAFDAGSGT